MQAARPIDDYFIGHVVQLHCSCNGRSCILLHAITEQCYNQSRLALLRTHKFYSGFSNKPKTMYQKSGALAQEIAQRIASRATAEQNKLLLHTMWLQM